MSPAERIRSADTGTERQADRSHGVGGQSIVDEVADLVGLDDGYETLPAADYHLGFS